MHDCKFTIKPGVFTNSDNDTMAIYFGENAHLEVTARLTSVQRVRREPEVGIFRDSYEPTDVDLLEVVCRVYNAKGECVSESTRDPEGIMDVLKQIIKEYALDVFAADHWDMVQEFGDAQADRYYESMMEDRRERDNHL